MASACKEYPWILLDPRRDGKNQVAHVLHTKQFTLGTLRCNTSRSLVDFLVEYRLENRLDLVRSRPPSHTTSRGFATCNTDDVGWPNHHENENKATRVSRSHLLRRFVDVPLLELIFFDATALCLLELALEVAESILESHDSLVEAGSYIGGRDGDSLLEQAEQVVSWDDMCGGRRTS